ncbi:ASCH domain-containing protein [Gemmata sp.]|uniref:ASCH domain-containing protein n=1 Tax=Gemmata sp. TaxID=1914242 RepID=UPI003F7288CB
MKCLSLWNPWATLVATGAKRVETRGWHLSHRGPLLIHAAKKWPGDLQRVCLTRPFREALRDLGVPPEPASWSAATMEAMKRGWGMSFGAIVGMVEVVTCVPVERVGRWENEPAEPTRNYLLDDLGIMGPADGRPYLFVSDDERAFGDYGPGRYAIVLKNPVRFERPVPCVGRQGLFEVPDDLIAQALKEAA